MRDYIFKGFHPDKNGSKTITQNGVKINGEWIEGQLCDFYHKEYDAFLPHICARFDSADVIRDTVGEFVKEDCKGNKVFEGDIVKAKFWSDWGECWENSEGTIEWDNGKYIIHIPHECMSLDIDNHPEMELVGNKWQED